MNDDPYDYVSVPLKPGMKLKCSKCYAKDTRIAGLEGEVQRLREAIEALMQAETNQQFAAAGQKARAALPTARTEIEALRERNADLINSGKLLADIRGKVESRLANTEIALSTSIEQGKVYEDRLVHAHNTIESMEAEIEQGKILEKENAALRAEIDGLLVEMKSLNKAVKEEASGHTYACLEMHEASARAETAEAEVQRLREALEWIQTKALLAHNVNHVEVYAIHRGIASKARAALQHTDVKPKED